MLKLLLTGQPCCDADYGVSSVGLSLIWEMVGARGEGGIS